MDYEQFLKSKIITHQNYGFKININDLNTKLFDWQKYIVRWALFKGKCALFEGCGLGKTPQQLNWAYEINQKTKGKVLILAPLAVAQQTLKEANKFGYEDIQYCRHQKEIQKNIIITNYEMLEHFDENKFVGIILDESSILKAFMGKMRTMIINKFMHTPYKLCCTATPSPNDYMELLNHSEFLNILSRKEALSRWFLHDSGKTSQYKIKKHAEKDFWQWVSTWAICIQNPSDIGFDGNGFNLPSLIKNKIIVDIIDRKPRNSLFREIIPLSSTDLYKELRESTKERADKIKNLINNEKDFFIVWCNTNYEADYLKQIIPEIVNLKGSLSIEQKEDILIKFGNLEFKRLLTKPSMCGFGLNWQHVNKMFFMGISYSFEQKYQAERRLWRYGQKRDVYENIILSPKEEYVYNLMEEKERRYDEMIERMRGQVINDLEIKKNKNINKKKESKRYQGNKWKLIQGDSCEEIKKIEDESVHFQIFSPPFGSLFIYSDDIADMGNCNTYKEFFDHFNFLIPELKRILIPNRLCAVHCSQLPIFKYEKDFIGLTDFRGDIIKAFQNHGWVYHSEVCIWKDPVVEMQRTKALGLLHKQIKKDSSMCRQGLPDYLVVFKKWDNNNQMPVKRSHGFCDYIGENNPQIEQKDGNDEYSINVWQRYASPVWFDIRQSNVLNYRIAKDEKDEKHICPLQLDVIRRAIHLWTNPDDIVFSPFAGIGSELYCAIEMGRKALGFELKEKYCENAIKFLTELENQPKQLELFK